MKPTVAIVGRPNVGKSTLLNRIIGRREAIVEEKPGVTRDRKAVDAEWQGKEFILVDTGGWLTGGTEIERKVSVQSDTAIDSADVLMLVIDASVGITEEDEHIVRRIRSVDIPVLVVANKVVDAVHVDQRLKRCHALLVFLGIAHR